MYNEHHFEDDYRDEDEIAIRKGTLNHIQHHLEAVLDILYGSGSIDLSMLENSLDEVANGLGMRLPGNDLLIERKVIHDKKNCQEFYDISLCHRRD